MVQLVKASRYGTKAEIDTQGTVARIAGNLKSMHFLQFTTASLLPRFLYLVLHAFSSNPNLNFSFRDLLQVCQ